MKYSLLTTLLISFFLLHVLVSAQCVTPTDGMVVSRSTTLCPGTYDLPNGVSIDGLYINLWCQGATLNGVDALGVGITIYEQNFATAYDCNLINYSQAIYVGDSERTQLWNINVKNSDTALSVFNSIGGKFYDMNIDDSDSGIRLGGFSNNNIFHSFTMNDVGIGFETDSINSNNIFYDSIINSPGNGIILSDATSYVIYDNFISDCTKNAIWFKGSSIGNMIYSNTFDGCNVIGDSGILKANTFCNGETGNSYLNGASGPVCISPTETRFVSIEENITSLWEDDADKWNAINTLNQTIETMENTINTMSIMITNLFSRMETINQTIVSMKQSADQVGETMDTLKYATCYLFNSLHLQNPFWTCEEISCSTDDECGMDNYIGDRYCQDGNVHQNLRNYYCNQNESKCSYQDIPVIMETCQNGCDSGECVQLQECFETDNSCGVWPNCLDCRAQDGCYDGFQRNYYCTSNIIGCEFDSMCTEACCDSLHQNEDAFCQDGVCNPPEPVCQMIRCFDLCEKDLDCCKENMGDLGSCYWSSSRITGGCKGTTEVCS